MDIFTASADAIQADIEHVKALLDDANPTAAVIGIMVELIGSGCPQSRSIPRKRPDRAIER